MRAELVALMPPPVAGNGAGAEGTYDFAEHCLIDPASAFVTGSIQNGSSRLLISQDFLPRSGTNRHLQDALRNKRFSRASGTTADQRARSSCLRAARQIGPCGRSLATVESPFPRRVHVR
jgi:hypothetical protein